MRIVFFDQVIAECNLGEVVKGLKEESPATRSYLFSVDNQKIVVETTATKLMGAIALLSVEFQARLMSHIATLVPNLGDSVSLVKREDGSTNLSAVITRLKPTGDEVRILITR